MRNPVTIDEIIEAVKEIDNIELRDRVIAVLERKKREQGYQTAITKEVAN